MSIFNKVQETRVKSNTFDLTHDVKLSTRFGQLTPICCIDTIPGDNFTISGNAMVRLAPTVAPVMHRADVYLHYFFVPNRIMWENWEDFITGGEDGNNASVHPTLDITSDDNPVKSLGDYMGIPTDDDIGAAVDMSISPFPFCAYQKIYDDYFRDENLITRIRPKLTDGDNIAQLAMLYELRKRAWGHDYFTSALPWTQRGPEAMLPLSGTADLDIKYDGAASSVIQRAYLAQSPYTVIDGTTPEGVVQADPGSGDFIHTVIPAGGYRQAFIDVSESHEVDLSSATASSIIDLRRAFKLQEWLEKNAVGGGRYIENIETHFGVTSSDKRLQRPEYIGGFQAPVKFSEVLQTSESATTPQGNMAGHGISVGGSKSYKKYCEEHGYIIGIMSILPKTAYQEGIPRHFLRRDKFDYPWPEFAHIGEQAIENREVYPDGTATDLETWGYIPRYAEMKFVNNRVAGDFRNNLDFWHMGRKFASLPPLNQDFVECDADEVNRIWAVTSGDDELWCQVLNQVKASRKLPVFGTPKL